MFSERSILVSHDLGIVWQEQASTVAKVKRARILRVENGIGALLKIVGSDLNHIKPAHSVLIAAIDGLEGTVILANDRLGGKAAHAEEHVQDVRETVGLGVVVRGTFVQRPL